MKVGLPYLTNITLVHVSYVIQTHCLYKHLLTQVIYARATPLEQHVHIAHPVASCVELLCALR